MTLQKAISASGVSKATNTTTISIATSMINPAYLLHSICSRTAALSAKSDNTTPRNIYRILLHSPILQWAWLQCIKTWQVAQRQITEIVVKTNCTMLKSTFFPHIAITEAFHYWLLAFFPFPPITLRVDARKLLCHRWNMRRMLWARNSGGTWACWCCTPSFWWLHVEGNFNSSSRRKFYHAVNTFLVHYSYNSSCYVAINYNRVTNGHECAYDNNLTALFKFPLVKSMHFAC